ncbi:hypothetical protein IAT38_007180 [Cryptococcus sp. DSM 104549]
MATNLPQYTIGQRYLSAKNHHPLTLRYVGPLPPSPSQDSNSASTEEQIWLGIEYDDPSHGKHSGVFKGAQVFSTREERSGAFLKFIGEPLVRGKALVQSIEERYGAIDPAASTGVVGASEELAEGGAGQEAEQEEEKGIVLGSSNNAIIVKTPNWQGAKRRVSKLENLRNMGFEDEALGGVGGGEEVRAIMRQRLRGVKWLKLSRNLIETWEGVLEIVECFQGLEALTLSHSRYQDLPLNLDEPLRDRFLKAFGNIKELQLSDCLISWDQATRLAPLFPGLEVLHLDANRTLKTLAVGSEEQVLLNSWSGLKELRLGACPIESWEEVVAVLKAIPSLESLDLSFTLISQIPPPSITFPTLKHLALLSSSITQWQDIDNISAHFPSLTSLRFSLTLPSPPSSPVQTPAGLGSTSKSNAAALAPPSLTIPASSTLYRSLIIPKFPSLGAFNSTPISASERRDAEVWYLGYVERWLREQGAAAVGGEAKWGRYEELCKVLGRDKFVLGDVKEVKKVETGLRRKMITLNIYTDLDGPCNHTVSVLPSSAIPLVYRKVAKVIEWDTDVLPLALYSIRELDDGTREKAVRVSSWNKGENAGWWFSDGDGVLAGEEEPLG